MDALPPFVVPASFPVALATRSMPNPCGRTAAAAAVVACMGGGAMCTAGRESEISAIASANGSVLFHGRDCKRSTF
eukprot:5334901-Amphidinium_carterae.2